MVGLFWFLSPLRAVAGYRPRNDLAMAPDSRKGWSASVRNPVVSIFFFVTTDQFFIVGE